MKVNKSKVENPLVSIITPTYNSEKFISYTLDSVMAQSYSNWEIIVVDDCSMDSTVDIIQTYIEKDSRIKLLQLSENKGAAVARNTAIENAKGQYLAFLDSDDQWSPEKLEKQIAFMTRENISFSFTRYYLINERGEDIGLSELPPKRVTYNQLIKNNVIGCLTAVLNREKIGHISMVDIRTRQDYVLWLDLCKRGYEAYGIEEPLAYYRVKKKSISSNKIAMAKQNWKVYREIEGLNIFKSSWFFLNYIVSKTTKYLRRP
ncbi:glycosyltransferase [Salipaludibacillus sp. LMS25]|jgi:teichuronic acid biosynthesis glycosyltransferase TuaG|uniref:glycosyltransferase family 2 protein n=1 Tax=Salipaludibacillus sp. LMS25 TaxID=2924031 RepID=UPI0020D0BF87|nr:glycosyltransferase family 2 protein [Salipaludibacillus sp. LMS25]UTR16217.1 glycosyltransferase [Salipaludibacillus sp. LMS25]